MPIPSHWTDDFFDRQRLAGDPLADQAMEAILQEQGPEEARRLFNLLIRRIEMPVEELPASISSFLEATDRLPAWVEDARLAMAHELFLDHGPKFLIFLYHKSLPLLYTMANGAPVLTHTGRLAQDEKGLRIFARRVAETGQFLMEVMTPGHLQPGASGIQAIQKVRLIHASIRAFLPREEWLEKGRGLPVNQEDMAMTLMTFSIALIDALDQFTVPEQEERLEAYLHAWTGIGEVLGVDPRLLPQDLEQARFLMNKILERQSAASEDGRLLTRALLDFAESILPKEFRNTPTLLIRHLIGEERAAMLGVQPAGGCLGWLLPVALQKYFNLTEKLEDKVEEPLHVFIRLLSRKTAEKMVEYFDKYKGKKFQISNQMQKAWFQQPGNAT